MIYIYNYIYIYVYVYICICICICIYMWQSLINDTHLKHLRKGRQALFHTAAHCDGGAETAKAAPNAASPRAGRCARAARAVGET